MSALFEIWKLEEREPHKDFIISLGWVSGLLPQGYDPSIYKGESIALPEGTQC